VFGDQFCAMLDSCVDVRAPNQEWLFSPGDSAISGALGNLPLMTNSSYNSAGK
jgi:hypothetical protein